MKRTWAITLTIAIIASLTPFTPVVHAQTSLDSSSPQIIGGPMPARLFLGPTFLHADGSRLYVVEELAVRVQSLFPQNDYLLGTFGFKTGQMFKPGGITTYQGISYITDTAQSKILVYGKMGEYQGEFKVKDQAQKPVLVNPIGISSYQGRLYIANSGDGNIAVCDTNGKFIQRISKKGTGEGELLYPTGICVASGKIFVTDPEAGKIEVFDQDGNHSITIPSPRPWAVFPTEGKVFITDISTNKVIMVGIDGTQVGEIQANGFIKTPKGVAFMDGKIYISSYETNKIEIFEVDGKHSGTFGHPVEQAAGTLGRPTGLAIGNDKLYVADSTRNKIIAYSKDGKLSEESKDDIADSKMASPSGVAVDISGNYYVADTANNTIKMFEKDGTFKKAFGGFGSGNGKLNTPSDIIIINPQNKLFVTDTGNNLVQVFSLSGDFLYQFGGFGSAPGQFNNPIGICTNGTNIFVADSANCRIQELSSDGKPIRTFGHRGRGKDMLLFPMDCSIDNSGKIYVADTYNHRLTVFDPETNFSWNFGKNGGPGDVPYVAEATCDEPPPDKIVYGKFNFPSGIVANDQGCFVSDTYNHRVQFVDFIDIFGDSNYLISPFYVDFGFISPGSIAEKSVYLKNISGGPLTGVVIIPKEAQWLKTHNPTFKSDEEPIVFYVDSNGVPAGSYETDVTIATNKDGQNQPKTIHFKIQIGDSYGFLIDTNAFITKESNSRIDIVINLVAQNGYTGTAALDVKGTPRGTYIQFSEPLLTLSKSTSTVMSIRATTIIAPGIYNITIIGQSPKIKYETRLDITLIVSRNQSFEPRTSIGETFTAVWCINCPYAHRAGEMLVNEFGDKRVVWLMYYVDSKEDDAHLYYSPADKRYKWYPGQGLPTTFIDGVNSIIGGDTPEERQKPPKDKKKCDKFSGTTFTYLRYKTEVERRQSMSSQLSIFTETEVLDDTVELGIEIETLQAFENQKNIALYVILAENNIPFEATNGDSYHNMVVREMYTGPLGEPITLVEGQPIYKRMTLKLPQWVNKDNANIVVWIQNNNSKEIYQGSNINLYEQPVVNQYTVRTQTENIKLEVDKEAEFKYYVTNTSTHSFPIHCSPVIKAAGWDYIIQVDGKEQKAENFDIPLRPMQSAIVSIKALPPEDAQPGIIASFDIKTSSSPIDARSNITSIETIPRLPPDFTFTSPVPRVELTSGSKTEFDISINPINDFDGPVSISNCTDNASIKVTITPNTGIPPFKAHVIAEGGSALQISEAKMCIVATGNPTNGQEMQHKIEIPVEVLYARLLLEANPKKIISCSENQSCHSSRVDINISTPIGIKEARFSVRYDASVLTVSHTSLGDFFPSKDTTYDFIDRSSEGIATVQIKSTEFRKGENKLFSVVLRGVKGQTKLGTQVEVCDVTMYGEKGDKVLTNVGCSTATMDIISQIAPPTLTADVKDDIIVDQEIYVIKGIAKSSDPQYPITLTINGRLVSVKPDGSYEYEARLREGKNNFVIIATDESGGSTGIRKTIIRDSTPPEINLIGIEDGMTVNDPALEIKGWVDEVASITLNGEPLQVNEYREFQKTVTLKDGPNKITIKATDLTGKTTTLTVTVILKKRTIIQLWLGKTQMFVNGSAVTLLTAPTSSSPPLPKDLAGSTFMPISEVAKALGVEVQWDGKEKRVTLIQKLETGTKKIELWIGKKTAKIDGKEVFIDSKTKKLYPTIVGGKTLLPLRFVGDALGADVQYEAAEKKITLTYPKL